MVTTMILHDGTLALVAPKPANPSVDHRVFRANPYGGYEWAHFADVDANSSRARWYGWGSPDLPSTMTHAVFVSHRLLTELYHMIRADA